MKKVIVLLAKGYLPDDGGIERYSTEIARAYAANGWRVIAITQSSAGAGIRRDRRVIVIDLGQANQIVLMAKFIATWRNVRKRFKPSIVHATTWRLSLPALLSGPHPPLVTTVHGREIFVLSKSLRGMMQSALRQADRVLVVSDTIRRAAADRAVVASDKWHVVWNGSSYLNGQGYSGRDRGQDNGVVHITTLCRLVARKNIPAAVRAIGLLVQRGITNFKYTIAGTGPDAAAIAREIDAFGLQNYVTLAGRIEDAEIPPLYEKTDIFLHPQIDIDGDIEGFGLVIADAMTFGAAIIAGKDGGPADFVRHEENGILCDGNDDADIADTLSSIIANAELRLKIGSAGQRWARENLRWTQAAKLGIEGLINDDMKTPNQ